MAPNKTTWGGISLRRRVTAWLAAILLVTMLSNGIATVVGQWAVRAFDALLAETGGALLEETDWTPSLQDTVAALEPGQFSGILKPDYVLPFKLSKEDAVAALKNHYKGKPLLPKAFTNGNHIEEIKGVYVPFWLFDANASGSGQYEATTSSSHRSGDYVITTTKHYDVRRAGTTQFMGVPVDGSTKMPNGHMDAIEPYDYRAFQPFSTAYLPGYMADKYDEDADTCQARAHSRMQNSVSSELSASITGYNSVSTLSENISIDYAAKHYALLPVWMLHTKWSGKDFLFAMNGQTGKLVGNLPVSTKRVIGLFAAIAALLVAISVTAILLMAR